MYNPMSNQHQTPAFSSNSMAHPQNRGNQQSYEPTGFVQSHYQPQPQGGMNNMNNMNGTGFQQSSSFHTAQYQGNQPNHDASWRGDSHQPSHASSMAGMSRMTSGNQPSAQGMNTSRMQGQSGMGTMAPSGGSQPQLMHQQTMMQQQPMNQSMQQQSPQSFHTAQYQGNRQGHDAYLRADAVQPTNMQSRYAPQMGGIGQGQGTVMMHQPASYRTAGFASTQPQAQQAQQHPNQFHTANYQGNQPGHDQQFRADSTHPSQYMSSQGSR